ncbi:MAG: ADP-glyceromanno-heptose 6-epimerase [Lentisphaerae bacterium]|nr:ADP-glyceromanno-heptose 6-epimerase [Lentisphaerota bacterium]
MNQPRYIVSGGAGFIGSNLVAALNARGLDNILIVDRLNHAAKQRNLNGLRYKDFVDKEVFRIALRAGTVQPAVTIFHLGACSSTTETNAAYLEDNNVGYSRDLCEWALTTGARFVYASSAATYGDGSLGYSDDDAMTPRYQPLNLYGHSKQKFDVWALNHRLFSRIVGLKYFNVYGPGEDHKGDMRSVVNKAFAQIRDSGELCLFKSYNPRYADGEQDRDFVYVRDAVNVTLYFHDHPDVSGLFNCGTGRARTWLDLAHAIFVAMGRAPRIRMIDMPDTLRAKYQYHTEAETTKLHAAGYRTPFTSIEDGVLDYARACLE